jgi:hypothetical protein
MVIGLFLIMMRVEFASKGIVDGEDEKEDEAEDDGTYKRLTYCLIIATTVVRGWSASVFPTTML